MKVSKQYKTRLNTDKAFWVGGSFEGVMDDNIRIIEEVQLKDVSLWKTLASFFGTNLDDADKGWRCEYWGKIMRGAAWVYDYTKNEELYNILTDTVRDLLTRQDEYGRFATYSLDAEFSGWDMWGRKYVIMGLLHYYDICRDESLKAEIIEAMKTHTDYIINYIGEDKKDILETSHFWGCLNSTSILEPIVRLYNLTEEERYLDFAEYIVNTGFCKDFNLIETA